MGANPITSCNSIHHPPPSPSLPVVLHSSPSSSSVLPPCPVIYLHASAALRTSPTPLCLQTDPWSPATANGPTHHCALERCRLSWVFSISAEKVPSAQPMYFSTIHILAAPHGNCIVHPHHPWQGEWITSPTRSPWTMSHPPVNLGGPQASRVLGPIYLLYLARDSCANIPMSRVNAKPSGSPRVSQMLSGTSPV